MTYILPALLLLGLLLPATEGPRPDEVMWIPPSWGQMWG